MEHAKNQAVRVRLAPSPTGAFHLGTARTALFNYLFAKQQRGQFILRFEDTDQERSTKDSEADIMAGLKWLGLNWDEGPGVGGPYAPYRQMERLADYRATVDQLIAAGQAYYCYCTKEELEAERKAQEARHEPPRYSGKCFELDEAERAKNVKAALPAVVRFHIPGGLRSFDDLVMGHVEEETSLYGDFVIMRADGLPLYNLANVVDDQRMAITHVIRGTDLLPSTIKQILLYEALNWSIPTFAHLPVILSPNGKGKMSKRRDPVSITHDFQSQGYLSAAMVNCMALLGWAPSTDREYFSLSELIKEFSLDKVNKANAVFNPAKLEDMNAHYIRSLSLSDLASDLQPYLERDFTSFRPLSPLAKTELSLKLAKLFQERLRRLAEITELARWFFADKLVLTPDLLIPKKSSLGETKSTLEGAHQLLAGQTNWQVSELEQSLRQYATNHGQSPGLLLWPLRSALTGQPASPGAFEVLAALGKERSLARLKLAIDLLASQPK